MYAVSKEVKGTLNPDEWTLKTLLLLLLSVSLGQIVKMDEIIKRWTKKLFKSVFLLDLNFAGSFSLWVKNGCTVDTVEMHRFIAL